MEFPGVDEYVQQILLRAYCWKVDHAVGIAIETDIPLLLVLVALLNDDLCQAVEGLEGKLVLIRQTFSAPSG